MPTYQYACKSCGNELEVQQSFTDEPLKVCPSCDGELRKVFGNIAVTFKGSGFYKTDNRSTSGSKSSSTESGSESKSDTKSETKSESKSESKSDSSSAAAAG